MYQISRQATIFLASILLLIAFQGIAPAQEVALKSKYSYSTPALEAARELYSQRNYPEAVSAFEEIIKKAKEQGNYEELIHAMERKALALRRLSRDAEVIEVLDEAINLAQEHLPKGHLLISKIYYTRGTTDHIKRNFYTARTFFDTAISLYENATTYDSAAYYRMVEYRYYAYQYSEGNSDTLVRYLDKLVELEEMRQNVKPNPDRVLQLSQGYPRIYIQKGDFEQALAFSIRAYKYALENREAVSNRYFAEALYDLTEVLYRKRDFSKAIETGLKAMPIVENTPKSLMPEYYSFNNLLGLILMASDKYEQAIPYFKKASEIPYAEGNVFQKRNRKAFYAQMVMNLGICYSNLGNKKKAKELLERSLSLRKEIVNSPSPDFHDNYEYLGDFYFRHSEWKNALNSYDSALRNGLLSYKADIYSFPENPETTYSYQDLRTLGRKARSMKEFALVQDKPETLLLSTKEYLEELHLLLMDNRGDLLATEGRLFLSENFKVLYETGIDVCYELFERTGDESFLESAWAFAKQSKSILFLEQSQEFDLVNTDLLSFEVKNLFFESKRRVDDLQREFYQLIDGSVTSDSIAIINELLLEARLENENVRDSIVSIVLSYQEGESIIEELMRSSEEVSLKSTEALIEYFYGEKNIYVLAKSNEAYSFNRIPLDQSLESSLESVVHIVSKAPSPEGIKDEVDLFKRGAENLYRLLLEPTLKDLNNDLDHLIIVPDEFLSRLPFEVLVKPEIEGGIGFHDLEYLIKSFSVQYELSSEMFNKTSLEVEAEKGILGVGFKSERGNELGSLPGTEREIQFLQSSFEGTFLIGETGSKTNFLNEAAEHDILHLAIHGKSDNVSRYESSLIFNGPRVDNTLSTNDLYIAGVKARLAVLSACESGLGRMNKGEGTFSIARGFSLVGVPSVVMSLWSVNDQTTSNIMVDMYRSFIDDDLPINESLRVAKLNYLETSDEYQAHPFFWAAFLQVGENILREEKETSLNKWWPIPGLLLLIFTTVMIRKRKRAK